MTGRSVLFKAGAGRLLRNRNVRRGQILALAVVIFFLFFLVATVLIDIYTLFEARNWGYRVAQQAALAGVSGSSTKWVIYQPTIDPTADTPTPGVPGCIDPVWIELDPVEAEAAADAMLAKEMGIRGVGGYYREIEVHEQASGGDTLLWPPSGVRLGVSSPDWSTSNPAVGVYLSFHVDTFLLSIIGIAPGNIHVFAAAEVTQPSLCP
jgi:hypothetical protein